MAHNDPPMLRTSERRAFKRCQKRWWWGYREGLKPYGFADPLWFGIGVHLALAAWYCGPGLRRGPEPAETWEAYAGDSIRTAKTTQAGDEGLVDRWTDLKDLGVTMLKGYRELYGNDDYIDVIAPEQIFSLDIPWPDDIDALRAILDPERLGQVLVTYKGTFDLPFRDLRSGKILIGETKTCKAISLDHLSLDDQAGSYWAVSQRTLRTAGLIGPKDFVAGVEYNFLRKATPDDRPKDAEGYATNKPLKADYIKMLDNTSTDLGSVLTEPALKKMKLDELAVLADKAGIIVMGERSKVQPPPLFAREIIWRTRPERRTQLLRIQDEALHMELVREGILVPTKNPSRDCRWDCEFFGLCELDEQSVPTEEFRELQFRIEDPYADHRKSTDD